MAKIYINEIFVSETKVYLLTWPNFEIEFKELLQINMYTRPTKIELELFIGVTNLIKVSRFEIDAPGIFSKTITSTSTLAEIVNFETNLDELERKEREAKNKSASPKRDVPDISSVNKNEENKSLLESSKHLPNVDNQQGLFPNQDGNQKNNPKASGNQGQQPQPLSHIPLAQNPVQRSGRRIKGKIFVQAEWDGLGPEMPPTKIENKVDIYSKQKEFQDKYQMRFAYDYPFDINDPRNVMFFDSMKRLKAEYILKNLYKEYILLLSDTESIRHYLLRKRIDKDSLRELKIPILETEIVNNKEMKELIKDLRKTDINETEEESEMKKKMQLDNLNRIYGERFLQQNEYHELLQKKIKAMKKDVVAKLQLSYTQVINEFDFKIDCRFVLEIFKYFFDPPRRLRPLRNRKNKVRIEKASTITMNIHIVKGYNIPVRKDAIKSTHCEQVKRDAIDKIYRGGAGSGLGDLIAENVNKSQVSNRDRDRDNLRNSFNPHAGTNNQSYNRGPNPFDINASGGSHHYNKDNPNLNYMQNPGSFMNASQGDLGNYNQPGGNQEIDLMKQYDGDILSMVKLLKAVEKNVESFVQVKMAYYDQELDKRTDSISGVPS